MLSLVPLKVLVRLFIVLPELPDNILADITVVLLDFARNFELVLRWHSCHLPTLAHQVEDELGDVAASDRDVLDGTPNNISLSARNNVRDAISRVDDGSGEGPVGYAVGRPGGGKGEDGLNGDIETLDVKRFEEDFSGLFAILRWVERGFGLCANAESDSSGQIAQGDAPRESSDPLAPRADT